MKTLRKIGLCVGLLTAAPLTIVGLLLMLPYGVVRFHFEEGIMFVFVKRLIGFKDTIGQNWGSVCFIKQSVVDERDAALAGDDEVAKFVAISKLVRIIVHEKCHSYQCMILTAPLYAALFILLSVTTALMGMHFYKRNPFELQARAYSNGAE